MAMSRSLLETVLRRSPRPRLPSPAASSSPLAGRFLAASSAYPTPAAAPSFLAARSGLSPLMGVRSYRSSFGSVRQLSTKENMKDKVTDDPILVKLIRRFLVKIGYPPAFTPEELQEWARNHKGWNDSNPSRPFFCMSIIALVEVMVFDNWKRIKESYTKFVDGLTCSRDRNAQDKND